MSEDCLVCRPCSCKICNSSDPRESQVWVLVWLGGSCPQFLLHGDANSQCSSLKTRTHNSLHCSFNSFIFTHIIFTLLIYTFTQVW